MWYFMNKYEEQLEKAIRSYEEYRPYHQYTVEWICNRIDWCWKWRKISENKMEDFANRIVKVMEEGQW